MKKILYNLFLSIQLISSCSNQSQASSSITEDAGCDLYPEIYKKSDDLYVAGIAGKTLSLAMERINSANASLWKNYSTVQSNYRVANIASTELKKGTTADGSCHFNKVLNQVSYTDNEIWVAYVTKAVNPQKIPNTMCDYCCDGLPKGKIKFAQDIEMFVTVTSSPNALLTSHLGITFSIETVCFGRTKGVSVDLHSFAAKVMLMRNPARRYMINAPVFQMEKMIIEALPGAVFVSTRETQKEISDRKDVTLAEFRANHEVEIYEKNLSWAENSMNSAARRLARELREFDLGQNPNREDSSEKIRARHADSITEFEMIEMDQSGNIVISQEKLNAQVEYKIFREMEDFKNPYTFLSDKNAKPGFQSFLEVIANNPPILSVDRTTRIKDQFTLYDPKDPQVPWLSVDKSNENYQWLFKETFEPAGITHYMVVNLQSLANCKAVE